MSTQSQDQGMRQPLTDDAAALLQRVKNSDVPSRLQDDIRAWLGRYEHANAAATVPGRPVGQDPRECGKRCGPAGAGGTYPTCGRPPGHDGDCALHPTEADRGAAGLPEGATRWDDGVTWSRHGRRHKAWFAGRVMRCAVEVEPGEWRDAPLPEEVARYLLQQPSVRAPTVHWTDEDRERLRGAAEALRGAGWPACAAHAESIERRMAPTDTPAARRASEAALKAAHERLDDAGVPGGTIDVRVGQLLMGNRAAPTDTREPAPENDEVAYLLGVAQHHIDRTWPQCKEWLDRACDALGIEKAMAAIPTLEPKSWQGDTRKPDVWEDDAAPWLDSLIADARTAIEAAPGGWRAGAFVAESSEGNHLVIATDDRMEESVRILGERDPDNGGDTQEAERGDAREPAPSYRVVGRRKVPVVNRVTERGDTSTPPSEERRWEEHRNAEAMTSEQWSSAIHKLLVWEGAVEDYGDSEMLEALESRLAKAEPAPKGEPKSEMPEERVLRLQDEGIEAMERKNPGWTASVVAGMASMDAKMRKRGDTSTPPSEPDEGEDEASWARRVQAWVAEQHGEVRFPANALRLLLNAGKALATTMGEPPNGSMFLKYPGEKPRTVSDQIFTSWEDSLREEYRKRKAAERRAEQAWERARKAESKAHEAIRRATGEPSGDRELRVVLTGEADTSTPPSEPLVDIGVMATGENTYALHQRSVLLTDPTDRRTLMAMILRLAGALRKASAHERDPEEEWANIQRFMDESEDDYTKPDYPRHLLVDEVRDLRERVAEPAPKGEEGRPEDRSEPHEAFTIEPEEDSDRWTARLWASDGDDTFASYAEAAEATHALVDSIRARGATQEDDREAIEKRIRHIEEALATAMMSDSDMVVHACKEELRVLQTKLNTIIASDATQEPTAANGPAWLLTKEASQVLAAARSNNRIGPEEHWLAPLYDAMVNDGKTTEWVPDGQGGAEYVRGSATEAEAKEQG